MTVCSRHAEKVLRGSDTTRRQSLACKPARSVCESSVAPTLMRPAPQLAMGMLGRGTRLFTNVPEIVHARECTRCETEPAALPLRPLTVLSLPGHCFPPRFGWRPFDLQPSRGL